MPWNAADQGFIIISFNVSPINGKFPFLFLNWNLFPYVVLVMKNYIFLTGSALYVCLVLSKSPSISLSRIYSPPSIVEETFDSSREGMLLSLNQTKSNLIAVQAAIRQLDKIIKKTE